jgi:hypothetical protein
VPVLYWLADEPFEKTSRPFREAGLASPAPSRSAELKPKQRRELGDSVELPSDTLSPLRIAPDIVAADVRDFLAADVV